MGSIHTIAAARSKDKGPVAICDPGSNRPLADAFADTYNAMGKATSHPLGKNEEPPSQSFGSLEPQTVQRIESARHTVEPSCKASQQSCLGVPHVGYCWAKGAHDAPQPPKRSKIAEGSDLSLHGHFDGRNTLRARHFPLILASFRTENGYIKAFVAEKLQLTLQETNGNCRIHGDNQAGSRHIPIHLCDHPDLSSRPVTGPA